MSDAWWGETEIGEDGCVRWRVGPLEMFLRRTSREWNLAYRWLPEAPEQPDWEVSRDLEFPEELGQERFLFAGTESTVRVEPALADRAVVTSPRVPLYLPPGEETVLYVCSPLWLRLTAEGQTLRELVVQRPSDTWFGPSTQEGELCYAARTRAVLDSANLHLQARRAATPVRILNRAGTPLPLEWLKLPVPYLSLYQGPDGRAWTDAVTLERSEPSEMARVRIRRGPPPSIGEAERLSRPRERREGGVVMQVFSHLLSALEFDDD